MKFLMPSFTEKLKPRLKNLDKIVPPGASRPRFALPKENANWLWAALAGTLIVLALLAAQNYSLMRKVSTSEKELRKMQQENSALLAKAMQERDALREELDSVNAKFGPMQNELRASEERAAQILEEKTYLEEILINKSKEIEGLRNQAVPQDLQQRIKEKEEEISRLADQNAVLGQKIDKLYKAVDEELADLSKNFNLGDAVSQAKKHIQDKSATIDLGSITVVSAAEAAPAPVMVQPTPAMAPAAAAVSPSPAPAASATVSRSAPKKQGRVLAINEAYSFLVVDLGKVDGLEKDSSLIIRQGGKEVGTLAVMELRDVMSACNITNLKNGAKPEVNDEVVIVKKR
jgi:predicted  nucleic acid-binding Zn-ribbon protein